jgi:hypothetical protein
MMDSEHLYQPIAALNDLLFCERRCTMCQIDGVCTVIPASSKGPTRTSGQIG